MSNTLNWFEIPVTDLARAVRFYEALLGISLKQELSGETPMAIFPAGEVELKGALAKDSRRKPSADGSLVYLNVTGKLDATLARVPADGSVVLPKTDIGPPGFIALIRDSEGNTIGLHSPR